MHISKRVCDSCCRRCLHVPAVRLRGTGIDIVISDSVRARFLHETVTNPVCFNYI